MSILWKMTLATGILRLFFVTYKERWGIVLVLVFEVDEVSRGSPATSGIQIMIVQIFFHRIVVEYASPLWQLIYWDRYRRFEVCQSIFICSILEATSSLWTRSRILLLQNRPRTTCPLIPISFANQVQLGFEAVAGSADGDLARCHAHSLPGSTLAFGVSAC